MLAKANMASPILRGTTGVNPFLSKYADITYERILIVPDKDFETAFFRIEYTIHTDKLGQQVPLLFYASDFEDNFRVWMDEQEVFAMPVRSSYRMDFGTGLNDFDSLYFHTDAVVELVKNEPLDNDLHLDSEDLQFFEVNMSKGNHLFRIEYTATNWQDRSDWISNYCFRYVLAPAKYWKSFGGLEIIVDNSNFSHGVELALSGKTFVEAGQKDTLTFSNLPGDILYLNFSPKMGKFTTFLTKSDPLYFGTACGILLLGLHLMCMKFYRRKYPNKRFSWVMIAGSFLVAFLVPFISMMYYELVDTIIGPYASRFHGYTFFILLLFPPLLFVYWAAMWRVDNWFARRYRTTDDGKTVN